jgi:hypothetical protein
VISVSALNVLRMCLRRMPASVHAELRHYQQEGLNWLSFLRQYGLHGILGDGVSRLQTARQPRAVPRSLSTSQGKLVDVQPAVSFGVQCMSVCCYEKIDSCGRNSL